MAVDYIKRLAGPYTGAGQKTFTFSFLIFTEEDVYVAVASDNESNPSNLNFGTDYTVSMNADQQSAPGGSITLSVALTQGQILVIGSAVDYTQTLDLTNYTRFPPERITKELDRIVVQIQQLVEITGRVLTVPATSSTTPAEMIEQLLSAQQEAQQYANAAAASATSAEESKNAAAEILDQVEDAAVDAEKILPYADDLNTVAKNIESVKATGGNTTNINIVAGDLDTTTQPVSLDYGDYDDDTGSGTIEVPTGGNIKTVADNIIAVNTVATNMSSILAIEDKIDGLDTTIQQMEDAVDDAETAASNASSSATAAAGSATSAATQATLAQDWAVKMDGKIVESGAEVDYSSKYYANVAAGHADDASAILTQVTQAGTTAVGNVQSAQSTAVQAVNSAGTTQIGAVEDAKDSAIAAVSAQQTTSVNAVNAAGQTQVQAVAAEGVKQAGLVEDAGESQVSAVNTAGAQQTANAQAQAQAAAQSAAQALQHKTDAESAKTAAETAKSGAVAAQTAAETAKTQAQSAQSAAETAAGTATSKATEASGYATSASNAQTAAEAARDAAIAAKEVAEDIAGEIGDPLGKAEAAQTYATKTEVTTGLNGKANTIHTHEISAVNGLQAALDGKQATGDYATSAALSQGLAGKANTGHTHTASQVTDLGALATKDSVSASDLAQTIDYGDYDA